MTNSQPSQRALATRSATAANRLTGKDRERALREHAGRYWTAKTCALTTRTSSW